MNLFFDTYALIEIMKNNPNYAKYKDFDINTCTINLSEFYYFLLKVYNEKKADYLIKRINFKLANIIQTHVALKSSQFRFRYKKEKLSYIDCLGYILSKEMNMKFLTGDEKFKNKDNVEFVK